ncbi:MAG: DUF481 domain-containing protein [Opitutales bacterium]|nr:DUF481 domain-containing protein [Opitutales bacterium]
MHGPHGLVKGMETASTQIFTARKILRLCRFQRAMIDLILQWMFHRVRGRKTHERARAGILRRPSAVLLFLGISLFAPSMAEAARYFLYFPNGERLAGSAVHDDGEYIQFESEALGTIRVPKDRIERIEYPLLPDPIDIPGVMVLGGLPVAPEVREEVQEDAMEELAVEQPEGDEEPADAEAVPEPEPDLPLTAMDTVRRMPEAELPPPPTVWEDNPFFRTLDRYNPIAHWDSQIQFGFTLNFGNVDQQDWSVRFQTVDSHHAMRNQRVELSWDYGTRKNAAGETFRWRDRKRGLYRFRYNFAERFYWQAATRYRSESTIGIRHEVDQTTGVGYTYVDTRRWKGSATPSVGVQYRNVRDRETEWVAIFSLFQDLEYTFNSRTRVRETFSMDLYPKSGYAVSSNFAIVLENQLSDRLRLNLRYEFSYNGLAQPGVTRDQQVISLSLATTF